MGQAQSFAINGAFQNRLAVVDHFILYPNQYITVEKSGNYTKHYYSGSEKIASALGSGLSFGPGNGAYRTQFETGVRGIFAASEYDEPQFFANADPGAGIENLCAEYLYKLRDRFKKEKNTPCEKLLDELMNRGIKPCEIIKIVEIEKCFENWDCDSSLEKLKDKLKKEKQDKCLTQIEMLQKQGHSSCFILFLVEKMDCKEKDSCQDAYDGWIQFFEEHRRYDCLQKLLADIAANPGMTLCKAVAYLEANSDCMTVETYEDCYEEFVVAYENCVLLYGEECVEIFSKYSLETYMNHEDPGSSETVEVINYCELLSFIIRLPSTPTPPVVLPERPRPGEGGGNGGGPTPEIDPVVPTLPIIPNPPFISGRIWWYHSDHLGSSSYLTDINGIPTHYYGYLPFGELMVEHNNSNYDNVYKFNDFGD